MEPPGKIGFPSVSYRETVLPLNDRDVEPTAEVESALVIYETTVLPLNYAGKKAG